MAKKEETKGLSTKAELELMDKLKVDVLYKNHKGEYFVSANLAALSIDTEAKKAGKKVGKVERHVVEGQADESEKETQKTA